MTGTGDVPPPPDPFEPRIDVLPAGSRLVRVFSVGAGRTPASFNPGFGTPTRFAFFGEPPVPVLYAGATEEASVTETVLHDVPVGGGDVYPEEYRDLAAAALVTTRDLRLAAFHGLGLRRLGVVAAQLTDTSSAEYPAPSSGPGPPTPTRTTTGGWTGSAGCLGSATTPRRTSSSVTG